MGLFSGFSRLTTNLSRVLGDVAPLVQAIAPIAAPGIGGILAGSLAGAFIDSPGRVVAAMNPCATPPAFSAPFRAANFPSGGSPSGRQLAFFNTFQPRSAVGRQVVPRCPSSCACPSASPVALSPRVAASVGGLSAAQIAAAQRFANFSGFGRRF